MAENIGKERVGGGWLSKKKKNAKPFQGFTIKKSVPFFQGKDAVGGKKIRECKRIKVKILTSAEKQFWFHHRWAQTKRGGEVQIIISSGGRGGKRRRVPGEKNRVSKGHRN